MLFRSAPDRWTRQTRGKLSNMCGPAESEAEDGLNRAHRGERFEAQAFAVASDSNKRGSQAEWAGLRE